MYFVVTDGVGEDVVRGDVSCCSRLEWVRQGGGVVTGVGLGVALVSWSCWYEVSVCCDVVVMEWLLGRANWADGVVIS